MSMDYSRIIDFESISTDSGGNDIFCMLQAVQYVANNRSTSLKGVYCFNDVTSKDSSKSTLLAIIHRPYIYLVMLIKSFSVTCILGLKG